MKKPHILDVEELQTGMPVTVYEYEPFPGTQQYDYSYHGDYLTVVAAADPYVRLRCEDGSLITLDMRRCCLMELPESFSDKKDRIGDKKEAVLREGLEELVERFNTWVGAFNKKYDRTCTSILRYPKIEFFSDMSGRLKAYTSDQRESSKEYDFHGIDALLTILNNLECE